LYSFALPDYYGVRSSGLVHSLGEIVEDWNKAPNLVYTVGLHAYTLHKYMHHVVVPDLSNPLIKNPKRAGYYKLLSLKTDYF